MIKKISDKDKKDWENFILSNEKVPNKELVHKNKIREEKVKKIDKILNVTVDFVSEVITCVRDKEKKVISGDPEKIKKIYDTWVFSRDIESNNPNWQLVDTLT